MIFYDNYLKVVNIFLSLSGSVAVTGNIQTTIVQALSISIHYSLVYILNNIMYIKSWIFSQSQFYFPGMWHAPRENTWDGVMVEVTVAVVSLLVSSFLS